MDDCKLNEEHEEHLNPVERENMKVNLAVQLYSNNLYSLLTFSQNAGVFKLEWTANFVKNFVSLFNS